MNKQELKQAIQALIKSLNFYLNSPNLKDLDIQEAHQKLTELTTLLQKKV